MESSTADPLSTGHLKTSLATCDVDGDVSQKRKYGKYPSAVKIFPLTPSPRVTFILYFSSLPWFRLLNCTHDNLHLYLENKMILATNNRKK